MREPRYGGVPGTTDGTFLHKVGVPIVTVGPGDREIPHQVNEFVRVDDLVQSARLYAAAIVLFLAQPLNSSVPFKMVLLSGPMNRAHTKTMSCRGAACCALLEPIESSDSKLQTPSQTRFSLISRMLSLTVFLEHPNL